VLKVPYKLVLKPCEFSAMSWPYEPVLMHPLVSVRNTTDAKAPGSSKRKPFFLLVNKSKSSGYLKWQVQEQAALLPKMATPRNSCFQLVPSTV
jgi:hypothetical protein